MTAVIANNTFSDGVLSMAKGDIRTIDDALATKYVAAGLVTVYTGKVTPSGTKEITVNGIADVYGYANVDVDVPNPSTGTLEIDKNGTYNVTDFASAEVAVDAPTETLEITENGTYNVTDFASAEVEVAGSGEVAFRGLLLSETVTTVGENEPYGSFSTDISELTVSTAMDITFDEVNYNNVPVVPINDGGLSGYYIGAQYENGAYDFTDYPFAIHISLDLSSATLTTATGTAGEHTVTIINVLDFVGATVTFTNNTDTNYVFVDNNNGLEYFLILANSTQEASLALFGGVLDYYFNNYSGGETITVTGDVTWDDVGSSGSITGDGTVTIGTTE